MGKQQVTVDGAKVQSDSSAGGDIRRMIDGFLRWAEATGFRTVDWWDIWATPYGRWAKQIYSRSTLLGAPAVASLLALDFAWPGFRRLFVAERLYPISLAHMGLGYLNLWEATREPDYLQKAVAMVEPLMKSASPKVRDGLGWGMKFDWTTVQGVVPADTPCNTQTAYSYELFRRLLEATGEARYRVLLTDIARHVARDFPEWRRGDQLVCSYSTIDERRVVNANSYRMLMLLDAGTRFAAPDYLEKGLATMRYVLACQQPDGSWPYSEDQSFVDTYHTCFVLKNLHQSRSYAGTLTRQVDEAVDRGSAYLLQHLLDKSGYPIPFAVRPRLTLQKYDSYDLAETIGLVAKLGISRERLIHLVRFAARVFQTSEGWFVFRVYPFGRFRGIPYIRYANTAMFLGLTEALKALTERGANPVSEPPRDVRSHAPA